MTVLGGLQYDRIECFVDISRSFNTDDGIRRATMRALQTPLRKESRFNTDDGIRRATI